MSDIRKTLKEPYWAATEDELPSHDFNKEILSPGTNSSFPDGVVGICADDDFWPVAALPYSYRDTNVGALVASLWPGVKSPKFNTDVGTEQ